MAFVFTHNAVTMRVQVNALWPRLVKRDAVTIWNTMFFRHGQKALSAYLVAHEYRHVVQWIRLGVFRFLWTYLGDMWDGYQLTDELEAEAHLFGLDYAPWFVGYVKTMQGHT